MSKKVTKQELAEENAKLKQQLSTAVDTIAFLNKAHEQLGAHFAETKKQAYEFTLRQARLIEALSFDLSQRQVDRRHVTHAELRPLAPSMGNTVATDMTGVAGFKEQPASRC